MVEPDVVVVPAGDALLGDLARTAHVNTFAIARHALTLARYAPFLDEGGHDPPVTWDTQRPAERPVAGVFWADAVACCRWLSRRTTDPLGSRVVRRLTGR